MPLMKIKYLGSLRTEAVHVNSGSKLLTDAPVDNKGKGEQFSPTDLFCTSVATCKLTTMAIKAESMGIDIGEVTMDVKKIMSTTPPRKVAEIEMTFNWNGLDQKITLEQMESLKRSAANCPVTLSLDPNVKETIHW